MKCETCGGDDWEPERDVSHVLCKVERLESKLDELRSYHETRIREKDAYSTELESRLNAAAKLCEVYFNIAVEAGVTEADIRRKRDERFKPSVVEKPCQHPNMIKAGERNNTNDWCPDCGWFPDVDKTTALLFRCVGCGQTALAQRGVALHHAPGCSETRVETFTQEGLPPDWKSQISEHVPKRPAGAVVPPPPQRYCLKCGYPWVVHPRSGACESPE